MPQMRLGHITLHAMIGMAKSNMSQTGLFYLFHLKAGLICFDPVSQKMALQLGWLTQSLIKLLVPGNIELNRFILVMVDMTCYLNLLKGK